MDMKPISLKKTCDICTKSKIKCSGGLPCERCEQKGLQCFYSPRKRRGTQKKEKKVRHEVGVNNNSPIVVKSTVDSSVKGALSSLAAHERRSWSVFFTLYKHYGTSCSLYWFNRQLKKMQGYLERRGDTQALGRLNSWMDAISVNVDLLTEKMNKCKMEVMKKAVIHPPGSVALWGIQGTVKDPDEKRLQAALEEKKNSKTPFLKIRTTFLENEQEGVKIECNEAFTKIFGHTAENLQKEMNWTGGGLLPWGGDVLGRLLSQEKDLLAFVQILAIKFNTYGPPKEIPMVREIPSCHMMQVEIKEDTNSGKMISVNCLIKCVHREVLKLEGTTLDISIDLTPLAPHDHLLNPEDITSQVELVRPAEVYSMKRRHSNDSLRVSDDEEEDDYVQEDSEFAVNNSLNNTTELLNQNLTQVNDVLNSEKNIADALNNNNATQDSLLSAPDDLKLMKAKSVSMSELEQFIDGEMPKETQDSYLTFDSTKSNRIDSALDSYASDVEEDYAIEDDWFEGLLDWSAEQSLPVFNPEPAKLEPIQ